MIPEIVKEKRRLVPRWRRLQTSIQAKELDYTKASTPQKDVGVVPSDLRDKLASWRREQSIVSAGELVESALVEGWEREGMNAAKFLLTSTATPSLQKLAQVILQRGGILSEESTTVDPAREKKLWRQRTRDYPQNALAWVELSYLDVITNQAEAAERSMRVALQLAPDNRHVLRSASRLYLHLQDFERAYTVLVRSDRTKHDPWLIAAEMSIADLVGKKPKFLIQGRNLVDECKFYPRQVTELAGALATLELEDGRRKKARDYFQQSLIDPNGNSLAQVEWAAPKFGFEFVTSQTIQNVSDADEAVALHSLRQRDYGDVIRACREWSRIEPYSARPLAIGGIAASTIGDFDTALDMTQKGLIMRPKDEVLSNTISFTLASLGRLKEAAAHLTNISKSESQQWYVSEANRGLISLRSGQIEAGLASYRNAALGFRRLNSLESLFVSQLYMVREAARAGISGLEKQISQLKSYLNRYKLSQYLRVLDEAEKFNLANAHLANDVMPLRQAAVDILSLPALTSVEPNDG